MQTRPVLLRQSHIIHMLEGSTALDSSANNTMWFTHEGVWPHYYYRVLANNEAHAKSNHGCMSVTCILRNQSNIIKLIMHAVHVIVRLQPSG